MSESKAKRCEGSPKRSLNTLINNPGRQKESETDMTTATDTGTWTVIGHWKDDRIVVEKVLPGAHNDHRPEDGTWEQGLFAASAEAKTLEEAIALVRAEYETPDGADEDEGNAVGRIVNKSGAVPYLDLYAAGARGVAPMLEITAYRSVMDGSVVLGLYSKDNNIGAVKVNLNDVPLCSTDRDAAAVAGVRQ